MTEPKEISLLNKNLRLLQTPDGFSSGLDSVMLGAACPAKDGEHIIDLGCGVGSAGFCVLERVQKTTLHGIDLQPHEIELANQNAVLNKMEDRAKFTLLNVLDHIIDVKNGSGEYDHAICNPPYMKAGEHLPSPNEPKAIAHADQDDVNLQDWVDGAFYSLKQGGSLSMIHRGDQVDKITQALGKRFGAIEIIPLWPKAGIDAKRVIVRAIKGRQTPTKLRAGLTLHQENGDYTDEAEKILRDGEAIL